MKEVERTKPATIDSYEDLEEFKHGIHDSCAGMNHVHK